MRILNIFIFCLCKWNWDTDFIFHKTNIKNSKKTGKHYNFFCLLYKNFMSKQRIPPNNSPFTPTPLFLEKIFYPSPFFQIRGTQSPRWKEGEGDSNYAVSWMCATMLFVFPFSRTLSYQSHNFSLLNFMPTIWV